MTEPVLLAYPFTGPWLVENSPANRLPSHGTEAFGTRYAIDFTPVDATGRSAPLTLRSWFASEPPERFTGYGRELLAPAAGTVVRCHDTEPDGPARRTPIPQLAMLRSSPARARAGAAALAGNHIIIALGDAGPYVVIAHLKQGSQLVRQGDQVAAGQPIAACGNSGNTTEPHVHLQANSSLTPAPGNGLPIAFAEADGFVRLPLNGEIVQIR